MTTPRPGGPDSADPVLGEERCAIVVDDDADIREAVADALGMEGYRVARAANGREALLLMNSLKACVVVLDLMMPVMSGWQVLDAMRGDPALRGIAVVVMTASSDAPADVSVVHKPFKLRELVAAMRRVAERRGDGETIH